ncbi:hypothetical protein [uncultured Sphingomonas sp.]|uniref:hypothetical protein n=1 Tax=uncultured Sphingomonas sp. TaxID=158754 RepID=UPI0035CB30AA
MLEPDAFGTADGRYIEQLMRRTAAPVASRWLSIALRRMLVQPLATPANVNGADFAAERAWLLVRMGESIGARAVVQSVDPDNYTPKLYQIALQAALASGDPAGLCPLVPGAMAASNERGWTLIKAICVGLSGESAASAQLIKRAGNSGFAGGVDLLLAQKLAGQGAGGRQAATIEWASVDHLSIWRFGLATASGETIPDTLFDDMGRQVRYWQVLSPMVDPAGRAGQAEVAAAQGVLSNLALVDLYGAVDADADQSSAPGAVARDLRAAYTGPTVGARMEALRQLWEEPKVPAERYGRLILTARAAARIPADPSVTDVNRLVAAMVSVGMDRTATRWTGKAARGSIGWALLALADPDDARPWAASDIGALDDPGGRKARMFLAGLAGLGKLDGAEAAARSYGVDLAGVNSWTRAIDAAARERRPGEVLVLAAVGMQTPDWSGVPPEALFHIVRALRVVGLGGMARMIAAEAVTRA